MISSGTAMQHISPEILDIPCIRVDVYDVLTAEGLRVQPGTYLSIVGSRDIDTRLT